MFTPAAQEYGSELNAVTFAMRKARETGAPCYAIETKYGWIDCDRKPSLRFGKVWECHPDGKKHHG
jgi:hypothetical protein